LELCTYHPGPLDAGAWAVPLRAVGWLEHPHPFAVGSVPAEFVARLSQFLGQTREHFPHYGFRGIYECSLCRAEGRTTRPGWSQQNLIVPAIREVYAAPGSIVHYVADHLYRPPASFLEAVASCPDCGTPEYFEAIRRANGGLEAPLQSFDHELLQSRARFETARAFRSALGVPLMQATRTQVLAAARSIWPDASYSDQAESIQLGEVTVTFDELGRVREVS
jgi:hypothetical protein